MYCSHKRLFAIFDCGDHLMSSMTQSRHDKNHSRVPPSSREGPTSQPEGQIWKPLVTQGQHEAPQVTWQHRPRSVSWFYSSLVNLLFSFLWTSNRDEGNLQETGTMYIYTHTHAHAHIHTRARISKYGQIKKGHHWVLTTDTVVLKKQIFEGAECVRLQEQSKGKPEIIMWLWNS